jgi:PAS domain S-box-containing protein
LGLKKKGGQFMKTKEETLSEQTASNYFWQLANFNVVPVITWDFDGHVLSANNAYLDLIGYTRDDFNKGKINWRSITPSEFVHLDDQCMKELQTKEIAKPYEKIYIRKDGSRVKIRLYNARARGEKHCVAMIVPSNFPTTFH